MEGTAVEAARSRFEQAMEEQARAQARNGHIAEWKNVFGPSFDVLAGEHVSTAVLRHQDAARTAALHVYCMEKRKSHFRYTISPTLTRRTFRLV